MARKKRETAVFGLAFLDAMTCGLGAVILLYMLIHRGVSERSEAVTLDASTEAARLEIEVLDAQARLAGLRASLDRAARQEALAKGLSARLLEMLEKLRVELATYEADTLAKESSVEALRSDLETLEQEARRLAAQTPIEEEPGDRVRAFAGDGNRQYLTGLQVGGQRILVLVDTSASMLDDTLVNILVRRNLPPAERRRARKWRQATATVEWLLSQFPRRAHVQVYGFAEKAAPLVPEGGGAWFSSEDRGRLDAVMDALRAVAPEGGTDLEAALAAARALRPAPDNVILLTDGLPTLGGEAPRGGKISGRDRLKLFEKAVRTWPSSIPIQTILYPMEGDPMAAAAFWKLAVATRGSFLTPTEDWP